MSRPTLKPQVEAKLRDVLGDGLITDPDSLFTYESDALTLVRAVPLAVALPRSTAETASVVRILAAAGAPFAPRGAGTGLAGGAVGESDTVVVSLARMDRILELDAKNRRARVEAGVVNSRLQAAAKPHGLQFAPDPSSQLACTLGGNAASNAGGIHCLKYGVTTNHVLSATVVLSDGEVLELGGEAGYDLLGVFVGSEGTMGLATELVVKLTPLPERVETLLVAFPKVEQATDAVTAMLAAGLLPAALELLDSAMIEALENSPFAWGFGREVGAVLLVELDGAAAGLSSEADSAERLCRAQGASEVRRATTAPERERLWLGRKKIYGIMGGQAPELLVQDAVVPRSRLTEAVTAVQDIARRHGIRIRTLAHAGDGNLHPGLLFDRRDAEQVRRVEAASRDIVAMCARLGGSISGEHGIGIDKREALGAVIGDAELAAMADVRRAFDPAGLANPHKVLPSHYCREWSPSRRVAS